MEINSSIHLSMNKLYFSKTEIIYCSTQYIYIYVCVCVCVCVRFYINACKDKYFHQLKYLHFESRLDLLIDLSIIYLLISLYIDLTLNIYAFVYVYHIYQPLRSGRIWHKVNFLSGV